MPTKKKKTNAADGDVSVPTTSNEDLLRSLAQQQTILTNLVQKLAALPAQQAAPPPPPPPSSSVHVDRSVLLPKLAAPEELSIPAFRDWKQRWVDFSSSRQLTTQSLDAQHGVLRSALHPEWTQLWSFGRLNIAPSTSVPDIVLALEVYLRQKRNPLLDRKDFHRRDQQQGESIDRYFAVLKSLDDACSHDTELLCQTCHTPCPTGCTTCLTLFPLDKHLQDIRIRDRLICGLRSKEIQQRILTETYSSNLTLERVLSICVAMENSIAVGASLAAAPSSSLEVNAAAKKKSAFKRNKEHHHQQQQQPQDIKSCSCAFCGKSPPHPRIQCPAADVVCTHCAIKGHFERVCRKRKGGEKKKVSPDINQSPKGNNTVVNAGTQQLLQVETVIKGTSCHINWLPDTGSEVDAISLRDFQQLGKSFASALKTTAIDVVAANKISLGPVDSFSAILKLHGKQYSTTVGVFQHVSSPLLSQAACKALGLVHPEFPLHLPTPESNVITEGKQVIHHAIIMSPPASPYIIPQRQQTARPHAEHPYERHNQFQQGTIVLTQNSHSRHWNQTAIIMEVQASSYLLRTNDGRLLQRHRRLIRPYHSPGTPGAVSPAQRPSSRNRRRPIYLAHSVQLSPRSSSKGGHVVSSGIMIPPSPEAAFLGDNASHSPAPANGNPPPHLHAMRKRMMQARSLLPPSTHLLYHSHSYSVK